MCIRDSNSAANSYLGFNVDNSEKLRIDSSARVIVDGSASGNNKLQINGTGNDTAFVRLKRTSSASNDSAFGGINVVDNNDVTIGTAEFRNQDSTTRGQFVLSTYNVTTGGLAEALRVRADGKVGINQSDPQRKLHVKSGANSTCLLYTSPSPRDQRGSRMPSSA